MGVDPKRIETEKEEDRDVHASFLYLLVIETLQVVCGITESKIAC